MRIVFWLLIFCSLFFNAACEEKTKSPVSKASVLEIQIRPGIAREQEATLKEAFKQRGIAIVGGGSMDGTTTDIGLRVNDVKRQLPEIKAMLQQAKVGRESMIWQTKPKHLGHSVY